MIVDSSALIAIIADEPERQAFVHLLSAARVRRISAATLVETAIVLESQHGPEVVRQFDAFLRTAKIRTEPVTEEQAAIARQAFLDFGKGRHPAALNFGDCFSYALAKAYHEPLLFKGGDFAKTDVLAAQEAPR